MTLYVIEERKHEPRDYNGVLVSYYLYRDRDAAKKWLDWKRIHTNNCSFGDDRETDIIQRDDQDRMIKSWRIVEKETESFKR